MFGVRPRKRVAKKPNRRYKAGEVFSQRQPCQARRSEVEYLLPWPRMTRWGSSGFFTFSSRRRRNSEGMGIFTGQTAPQAPPSAEAEGWPGVVSRPIRGGEMMLRIGRG